MKNTILLLSFILSSYSLFAKAKEYDAVMYQLNGDSVICKVTDRGITIKEESKEIWMARKIEFILYGLEEKKKATDIAGFKVNVNGSWWVYESRQFRNSLKFMLRESYGSDLRLYSFVDYNPLNTYAPLTNWYVFQKVKEKIDCPLVTGIWSNKNKIVEFFDNCSSVSEKVNDEKINLRTKEGLIAVMQVYEQKCTKK